MYHFVQKKKNPYLELVEKPLEDLENNFLEKNLGKRRSVMECQSYKGPLFVIAPML